MKVANSKSDSTECKLLGSFVVPDTFTQGKPVVFTVLKQSLLFQSTFGEFLAVESDHKALLAAP